MSSSLCCQSSDTAWLAFFFWKQPCAFCCLRNLLNCSFPWPEFSVFWDMLVIIAPLGLPPVLRWPLLVSSSQQLTDLVITNHNILWKSQRRVSDYLVTQRRMVVTFMPDQPAFSQPKTRQKFSWTPGKQLFANTTCGWLQAIFLIFSLVGFWPFTDDFNPLETFKS